MGSRNAIIDKNPKLRKLYSKSQWYRRTKRSKVGIEPAKCRTDLCDYCHQFDFVESKALSAILKTARAKTTKLVADYWKDFDDSIKGEPHFNASNFDPTASPSYLTMFAQYMKEWKPKAELSDEKLNTLLTIGNHVYDKFHEDKGWIEKISGYSAHWSLRDHQEAAFNDHLTNRSNKRLVLHLDMEEIATLPKGPGQTSAMWYANERLAYSTMGVHIFSGAMDKFVLLLGRTMDKSTAYAFATLEASLRLAEVDFQEIEEVQVWTDGPRQFKSLTWIASLSDLFFKTYPKITKVGINYGCPKHFKACLDRLFGVVRNATHDEATRKMLEGIGDVTSSLQHFFAQQQKNNPNSIPVIVNHFEPPEKSSLPLSRYSGASCFGINHSYAFTVTRTDARRKNLRGRGCQSQTMTGLLLKNTLMTNVPGVAARTGHPVLENRADQADEEDPAPVPADGSPPLSTKWWKGWRCSYKKDETPSEQSNRLQKTLSANHNTLAPALHRAKEPFRCKTMQEKSEAMEKATEKRRARAKATRAALKALERDRDDVSSASE